MRDTVAEALPSVGGGDGERPVSKAARMRMTAGCAAGWTQAVCTWRLWGLRGGLGSFRWTGDLGTTAWYLLSVSLTHPDISCLKLPSSSP